MRGLRVLFVMVNQAGRQGAPAGEQVLGLSLLFYSGAMILAAACP
jgi:hypothetical protein